MRKKRAAPKTYTFQNVMDLRAVPVEKLRHVLYDLELWLRLMSVLDATGLSPTTPPTAFTWSDDGRHDVSCVLTFIQKTEDGTEISRKEHDIVDAVAGPVRGKALEL